jgi:hypothetical protein
MGGRGVRSPVDILFAGVPGSAAARQLGLPSKFLTSLVPPERRLEAGETLPDDPVSQDVDE